MTSVQVVSPPEKHRHRQLGPGVKWKHLSIRTRARFLEVILVQELLRCREHVYIETLSYQSPGVAAPAQSIHSVYKILPKAYI